MSDRIPCNICGAEILVATALRTDGRCMPCSRDPGRIARMQAYEKSLREKKRLTRDLESPPVTDPFTRLQEFESLIYGDGFDQAYPDEVVGVLDALKQVNAPICVAILNEFLDFIEAGCSPEGYYDPSLVGGFLVKNMGDRLGDFWTRYTKASESENPAKQLEDLLTKDLE
jgi:hypothetical protein